VSEYYRLQRRARHALMGSNVTFLFNLLFVALFLYLVYVLLYMVRN